MELLKVFISHRKGKELELRQACEIITKQTRNEIGCLRCSFFQNSNDESCITLEQEWETRYLLDNYCRSDHFSALLGAMKWLGKNYEVTINNGTQKEGEEAIKKVRSTGDEILHNF